MKTTRFFAVLSLVLGGTLLALPTTATAAPPTLQWIRLQGGIVNMVSHGVSADGLGNVYISGFINAGGARDAFTSKYDTSGTLLWTEQLGTSSEDTPTDVSADGLGNVYISGLTRGSLGGTNAGLADAFLSKYNASGTLLWTEQLGTSSDDISHDVSADGLGNVYISGWTFGSLGGTNAGSADAFVSKYDASGTLLWTEQLGTSSSDVSRSVSADGLGNVYISGSTYGSLGGTNAGSADAFVSKYDPNGILLWTEQLGTSSDDFSRGVSADGLGNVYISGYTRGSLGGTNAGDWDAFVSKYDASGALLWTEQLGTSSEDKSFDVSADGLGNVYISGWTFGSLGGTNAGAEDAFVSKYDASGTLLWTEQLGTSGTNTSSEVSADGLGNVYISGRYPSTFFNRAYVAKFTDLPGDFDGNGIVDGKDFLKWQRDDGSAAGLALWKANYGMVASLSATSATVPEPTTCTLALAALCLAMSRRRAF